MSDKRLVIIDGYSLLFRAFYGTRYLSTSDGKPTNALFGFVGMLFQLFDQIKPDALVVALDAPGKTFRHTEYSEYKGTRRETPQELISQLEGSRAMIEAFNLPVIELTGFEADDVVGTISRLAEENGYKTTIVTGDLDSLQLVDECVTVMTTKRGVTDVVMYDPAAVVERYGFGPEFVPDYKALVGDTSDNIPGVPGIGDKSASILIQEFGGIEQIIERMAEIPEKFRKKLEGNEDRMRRSKWLATIVRDAPLSYNFEPYRIDNQHLSTAREMLNALEFRSQSKKLEQVLGRYLSGPIEAIEVVSVDLESDLLTESVNFADLMQWVGTQPFGVLPPPPAAQTSLLELDDEPEKAYVAVGRQVRMIPWADAQRLAEERPRQLIAHETKPLYKGKRPPLVPPRFDVTLASYVLQSGRSSFDLQEIAAGYLDVSGALKPQDQAVALLHLETAMRARLDLEGQSPVLDTIELPLVPILAEMERIGIALNGDTLREFSGELGVAIDQAQKQAWEIASEEFNLGSPKQIGEVLFEKMALPGGKKTKTGWATGAEILQELEVEHEIAHVVLQYRELTKLKGTYADALPRMIGSDGRIHTTFNQAVAATGRLSSNDPNLQNIPIRTELGRTIRRAFVAAPGFTLGSFDYSQIELRILASMCGDEALVSAFQDRVDVHTVTASLMYDIPSDQVTKDQRRLAKLLNYAVLYGVTGYGLAAQLGRGFGVDHANDLIRQYNERFPRVKAFTEGMVEEARSKGFTTTLRGRRRYFPDIHAGNRQTRAYAERQAMNAPIQGTAADMIKLAMIDVAKMLRGKSTRMLLQVHDELVFECAAEFDALREPVRAAMENALPLEVPVEVDAKFGANWQEMTVVERV